MAAHPPVTLQDPCLVLPVKIQFRTSSRWPGCCLSLSERLWLKHSLIHLQARFPCWWKPPAAGQPQTWRIGRAVPSTTDSFFLILLLRWRSLGQIFVVHLLYFKPWSQIICHMLIGVLSPLFPLSGEPSQCNGTSKVSRKHLNKSCVHRSALSLSAYFLIQAHACLWLTVCCCAVKDEYEPSFTWLS